MSLEPVYTNRFKRDIKRLKKQQRDMEKLKKIMKLLAKQKPLAAKYRDHPLIGNWVGHRDCHVEPDWVLIYRAIPEENEIRFERTGSHSELF